MAVSEGAGRLHDCFPFCSDQGTWTAAMDDQLEKPAPYQPLPTTAVSGVDGEKRPDDEDQSSDDEDGGPDWTKLSSVAAFGGDSSGH